MAMGGKGQREATCAIASCRPFNNSTGSLKGTRGSTRTLGWLESHTDARRIRELLGRAVYVVWSYGTPIAFVHEAEDGERTAYYVDESHSATTAHHQTLARVGMGEYETIGARPRRSRSAVTREDIERRADAEARSAEARRARREREASIRAMENGANMAAHERWVRQGETRYDPQGVQEDDAARASRSQMLDPRYVNPDWTPWTDDYTGNLPDGAEARDRARVEREQAEGRGFRP